MQVVSWRMRKDSFSLQELLWVYCIGGLDESQIDLWKKSNSWYHISIFFLNLLLWSNIYKYIFGRNSANWWEKKKNYVAIWFTFTRLKYDGSKNPCWIYLILTGLAHGLLAGLGADSKLFSSLNRINIFRLYLDFKTNYLTINLTSLLPYLTIHQIIYS